MSVYFLETNLNSAGRTSVSGVDSAVVVAHNEEDARAVAKATFTGVSGPAWENAQITELRPPDTAEGFQLVVAVSRGDKTLAEAKCVGEAGESLDDIATRVARALNETEHINGAGHNATDHVLTVASPVGGDRLGDCRVYVAIYPPQSTASSKVGIPGCIKAVSDQGNEEDALQVVLPADSYSLPCRAVSFAKGF